MGSSWGLGVKRRRQMRGLQSPGRGTARRKSQGSPGEWGAAGLQGKEWSVSLGQGSGSVPQSILSSDPGVQNLRPFLPQIQELGSYHRVLSGPPGCHQCPDSEATVDEQTRREPGAPAQNLSGDTPRRHPLTCALRMASCSSSSSVKGAKEGVGAVARGGGGGGAVTKPSDAFGGEGL